MNIYVGNLARELSEADLRQTFEAYGQVTRATIVKDKFTGEARGFGFVEMPTQSEAEAAMSALNGKEVKGRRLTVNEARPKTEGGGGDRRGGGGHRGGSSSGGRRW